MALPGVHFDISHRSVETNGIQMHVAECGTGPLVLLLHGFPEFWYGWRKQLKVISQAGFHVVAPDLRGVGGTDCPESPHKYTILHQVGDIIGLMDALGQKKAFVVGHDWGAVLSWHVALFRPDRVWGLATLSVPYFPRSSKGDTITRMRNVLGDGYYMHHFQAKERGEEEWMQFGLDKALKAVLLGSFPRGLVVPPGETFPGQALTPDGFPPYFSEEELKAYVDNFSKTGMTGSFNYYRHLGLSWDLTAAWTDAPLSASVPVLFIAGDADGVIKAPGVFESLKNLKSAVPGLQEIVIVENAAHFVQWQKPKDVNGKLLQFFERVRQGYGNSQEWCSVPKVVSSKL